MEVLTVIAAALLFAGGEAALKAAIGGGLQHDAFGAQRPRTGPRPALRPRIIDDDAHTRLRPAPGQPPRAFRGTPQSPTGSARSRRDCFPRSGAQGPAVRGSQ
jgi:hypothetical protein